MSMFFTAHADCPLCGTHATLEYPASINADRRPDLRAAILDRTLFTTPCAGCGEALMFDPHITYLDMARRQWILADAAGELDQWHAHETESERIYQAAFGAGAPTAARTIGADLTPRLVFGWPALIEKLLCADLGLDDIALEALKLAVIKDGPEQEFDPAQELRLTARWEPNLVFTWIDPVSGSGTKQVTVPESAYVVVKGGEEAWRPVTALFAGTMFVDINRVLRDPAP